MFIVNGDDSKILSLHRVVSVRTEYVSSILKRLISKTTQYESLLNYVVMLYHGPSAKVYFQSHTSAGYLLQDGVDGVNP